MPIDPGLFTSPGFTVPSFASLSDPALLETQRSVAETRRRADALAAALAAEVAHRSRLELGYEGLAVRLGARTPALLVQQVTGVSAREANALVRVGGEIGTTPLGSAVATGSVSVEAAQVIRAGLGSPTAAVTPQALDEAASRLLALTRSVTVERLASLARDARAALDLAADDTNAAADREQALRDKRYLHVIPQSDGMTRLSGLLDPESAALVVSVVDTATSPRRGGPRFVEPGAIARSERILTDPRSTEQIALDTVIEILRTGSLADAGVVLGGRTPAVQVLVTDHDLRDRRGLATIEGQREPNSIATAERHVCESGTVPILLNGDGQVVDVGRQLRLYNTRQRIGLAARDGGCRFPGCDRPPSWCEAHHLVEWSRGGDTDLANGILLCRHHHMLVHNNGWRVTRRGADYFVVPPTSIDPAQAPVPAPSRSRALERALA